MSRSRSRLTEEVCVLKSYSVVQLQPFDVDRVYPLIEPVASTLDLAAWRRFCATLAVNADVVEEGEHVWIAVNPIGVIQGLALCRLGDDFAHRRMLDVPIFVVASAADDAGVSKALVDKLRNIATDSGCTSIRFWTLTPDNWRRRLQPCDYSHWDHGVRLVL